MADHHIHEAAVLEARDRVLDRMDDGESLDQAIENIIDDYGRDYAKAVRLSVAGR